MSDSDPSPAVSAPRCPHCHRTMRLVTSLPAADGMRDLSYKCDGCGRTTGAVQKAEDRAESN